MDGSFNYLLTRQVVLLRYAHAVVPLPQNQTSIRPVSRLLAKGYSDKPEPHENHNYSMVDHCERASPARPAEIDGVYNGSYAGDKGPTKLKLTITQLGQGKLGGVFTVYLKRT